MLPSFGAAWKSGDRFAFGIKLDEPFLRHADLSSESSIRFLGRSIDLKAERLEFQAAWAFRPDFSFGAGFGVARLSYGSSVNLRTPVLLFPTQSPDAATNPTKALAEVRVQQSGTVIVPSFSLGFRWAVNPRWTVAGTHQGALRGDVSLSASQGADKPVFVGPDGNGQPEKFLEVQVGHVGQPCIPLGFPSHGAPRQDEFGGAASRESVLHLGTGSASYCRLKHGTAVFSHDDFFR